MLNIDVAAKKLQFIKCGCFTHIFHPAAQKIATITAGSWWAPKIGVTHSAFNQG